MSHVSVKQASGPQPSLQELFAVGSRLLTLSIDNASSFLRQAASLLPPIPAPGSGTLLPKCNCDIPETECPPRCVCDVTWEASPGETPGLILRMRNASSGALTFQLHATPFVGAGGSPGTITLAPDSLSLPAGHAGIANATFTVPNLPEGDYEAEILVQGNYEQCVRVRLRIRCEKTCGVERCTCDVVQGDPPVRIRAHRWYDHFQCTGPCFKPLRRPPATHQRDGNT